MLAQLPQTFRPSAEALPVPTMELHVRLDSQEELDSERACFYGTILATLAYGALAMLYIQLIQVLLVRPRRDRTFWAVVAYSIILGAVVTLAISGRLKFSELQYIENQNYPGGYIGFFNDHATNVYNSICYICMAFFPWFADTLMFFRLYTLCNKKKCVLIFPALTYVSQAATSIPLIIAEMRPNDKSWSSHLLAWILAHQASTLAFNMYCTFVIAFQIIRIRKKLVVVSGRLHASFYTSAPTIFVESGGFFTCWVVVYLVTCAVGNYTQDTFLFPYIFIQGITRMLLVLRIAQDRAWSLELVTASERGVLDWQVSSSHSVPLQEDPFQSHTTLFYHNHRRTSQKLDDDIHSISRY